MFRYILFPFAFAVFIIYAMYTKNGPSAALNATLFMGILITIDLFVAYGKGKFDKKKEDT